MQVFNISNQICDQIMGTYISDASFYKILVTILLQMPGPLDRLWIVVGVFWDLFQMDLPCGQLADARQMGNKWKKSFFL